MTKRFDRRGFLRHSTVATGAAAVGLHLPKTSLAADDKWGDLTGKLVYDGPAPERKKLKVDKDVECCGKFDIRDESLMVGPEGQLGNVYVYVRSRGVPICPDLEANVPKYVTLDNIDCIFAPHCLLIWYTKQELKNVNKDPVAQNIDIKPLGDMPMNSVLKAGSKTAPTTSTYKFSREQRVPVPVSCNYHPWESAFILPRSNPYYALSSLDDGSFSIKRLPVGELEFQVWQERVGYLATPQWVRGRFKMTIKPGANDLGTIKIDPKWLVKA